MKRSIRTSLAAAGFFVLAITAALASPQASNRGPSAKRPNILLIYADDQRADTIGAHGNPYVSTPTLDRLARSGYAFRNAYCMGSPHGAVCAPSRTMLLTGRGLHHVGDRIQSAPLLPQMLQETGYTTFLTGKWHFWKTETCRGFDRARSVMFQGMSNHEEVPARDLRADGTWSEPESRGFSSTIFANEAIAFFDDWAQGSRDKPFFAYVAFSAPHDPRMPPPGWRRTNPEDVPLPPNFRALHPFDNQDMRTRDEKLAAWPRTARVVREQLAEYYDLIAHLDHEVGRVLEHLETIDPDCMVIYAADHGLAMGSHGLLGKQSVYEHSMKAPLIVKGPGVPVGESKELVYLHDIFATVHGFAGSTPPKGTDAIDLARCWTGEKWPRDELRLSYGKDQRSIRDGRYKLILYPRIGYRQLFDLEEDPHEIHDLAGQTGFEIIEEHLEERLHVGALADGDRIRWTIDPKRTARFVIPEKRETDRWQPEWIRRKYFGERLPPWDRPPSSNAAQVDVEPHATLVVFEEFKGPTSLDRFATKGAALHAGGGLLLEAADGDEQAIAVVRGWRFGSFVASIDLVRATEPSQLAGAPDELTIHTGYDSTTRQNITQVPTPNREKLHLRVARNIGTGELHVSSIDPATGKEQRLCVTTLRQYPLGAFGVGTTHGQWILKTIRIWSDDAEPSPLRVD
ncbi:MAG: sulfatase-like hydrolase/transferase [Planctomycetes bacterium]|nr:sulfatase-like hydrolase/transferase [Planctomycetota bacterium]